MCSQRCAKLEEPYAAFLATPVTFQLAARIWQPTLAQLGRAMELEQTAERAYSVGRSADLFTNASETLAIEQESIDLPLRLTAEQPQL